MKLSIYDFLLSWTSQINFLTTSFIIDLWYKLVKVFGSFEIKWIWKTKEVLAKMKVLLLNIETDCVLGWKRWSTGMTLQSYKISKSLFMSLPAKWTQGTFYYLLFKCYSCVVCRNAFTKCLFVTFTSAIMSSAIGFYEQTTYKRILREQKSWFFNYVFFLTQRFNTWTMLGK